MKPASSFLSFVFIQLFLYPWGEVNGAALLEKVEASENQTDSLPAILRRAFNRNIGNFEKVMTFIRILPTFQDDALAYPAILQEMKAAGLDTSPWLLWLSFNVQEDLKMSTYRRLKHAATKTTLGNLNTDLESSIQILLNRWASDILHGNTSHIVQFLESYYGSRVRPNVIVQLFAQVSKQGGGVEAAAKILQFIERLRISQQSLLLQVLDTLVKQMRRDGLLFSWPVHELLRQLQYRMGAGSDDDDFLEALIALKMSLPRGVRKLSGSSTYIIIVSREHKYTLYGSLAGYVYSYPHDNYDGGENQHWLVQWTGRGWIFTIENVQNGNFLYGDSEGHAYAGRGEGKQFNWIFEPINEGEYFYIRNEATGGLLDVQDKVSCMLSKECCCTTVAAPFTNRTAGFHQQWAIW